MNHAEPYRGTRAPVALLLPSLAGGGAERMMLRLADLLVSRGLPVHLLVVRAEGEYLGQLPAALRVIELASSRPSRAVPSLVAYLRRARPEVLLATLTHANLAAIWAARIARTRTRCVVREAASLSDTLAYDGSPSGRLMPYLVRWSYPLADAIVALSSGVADDLARIGRLPRGSIHVVYNPIDPTPVARLASAPVTHPWFRPGAPPVIVALGRLSVQKGFDILLRVFARVSRRREARLLILGEGEMRPALNRQIEESGLTSLVDMPGFVANPYAYLARASVFAFPSRWEGLGNALLEALVCGVPIVSSDCPSGPAEVLDHGRYGRLVPTGDEPAWERALIEALDGGVPPAPAEALRRFDPKEVTRRFVEILLPGSAGAMRAPGGIP